jgi:hypothetical protein
MIQKKLHIPGEVERASLEMDKSWREVSEAKFLASRSPSLLHV